MSSCKHQKQQASLIVKDNRRGHVLNPDGNQPNFWEFVRLKRLRGKVNLNAGELSNMVCQDFFYKKHDILAHWQNSTPTETNAQTQNPRIRFCFVSSQTKNLGLSTTLYLKTSTLRGQLKMVFLKISDFCNCQLCCTSKNS